MFPIDRIGDALAMATWTGNRSDVSRHIECARDLTRLFKDRRFGEASAKYYVCDAVLAVREPTPACDAIDPGPMSQPASEGVLDCVDELEILSIAADELRGITMIELKADLTNADGERTCTEMVLVQRWKRGRIVQERLYGRSSR